MNAALAAGFRESGISGLYDSKGHPTNAMVAVRSSGLSLDTIVGFQSPTSETRQVLSMVSEVYLRTLIRVANDRFEINMQRTKRFRLALLEQVSRLELPVHNRNLQDIGFEPADVRKQRKRREGLLMSNSLRASSEAPNCATNRQSERMQDEIADDDLNFDLLSSRLEDA